MKLHDFLPLDYYQVQAGTPLVLEIGYVCKVEIKQLSIHSLISTSSVITYNIGQIQFLLESAEKLAEAANTKATFSNSINQRIHVHYVALVEMLYSLTEDNFKKKKEKLKYHKFLTKELVSDVEKLHGVITKVLEYNSGLKKKLLVLQNFSLWGNESLTTAGGDLFSYYAKKYPGRQSTIQPSLN